jgi:hypothetical protein
VTWSWQAIAETWLGVVALTLVAYGICSLAARRRTLKRMRDGVPLVVGRDFRVDAEALARGGELIDLPQKERRRR